MYVNVIFLIEKELKMKKKKNDKIIIIFEAQIIIYKYNNTLAEILPT